VTICPFAFCQTPVGLSVFFYVRKSFALATWSWQPRGPNSKYRDRLGCGTWTSRACSRFPMYISRAAVLPPPLPQPFSSPLGSLWFTRSPLFADLPGSSVAPARLASAETLRCGTRSSARKHISGFGLSVTVIDTHQTVYCMFWACSIFICFFFFEYGSNHALMSTYAE